ncbi:MAG: class I SAM-dependent methyltransferase [Kiloniellaceae bacterium]
MTPDRIKLLAESAALAHRLAPSDCWKDGASGEGCAWYHGFWPYLRLLDYGSSPALHAAFYRDGLAPLAARDAAARVLVSGAADFAMLEVAHGAFGGAAKAPRFTVTDRCATPLALSRWYAEQAGFDIEARAADIFSFSDDAGFDAIVTHSFLGNFPPHLRPRLLAGWRGLLRPGGRLLTVNRIRGGAAPAETVFSTAEADAFVARLTGDLERHRQWLKHPVAEIAAMARAYLNEKKSYPVRTREELAALFDDAGFELEVFAELETGDPGASRPAGPTLPGGATYMKIVARR